MSYFFCFFLVNVEQDFLSGNVAQRGLEFVDLFYRKKDQNKTTDNWRKKFKMLQKN